MRHTGPATHDAMMVGEWSAFRPAYAKPASQHFRRGRHSVVVALRLPSTAPACSAPISPGRARRLRQTGTAVVAENSFGVANPWGIVHMPAESGPLRGRACDAVRDLN